MSKKTGYLLGILLTIIIGMILMWFLCCGQDAAIATEQSSDGITNTATDADLQRNQGPTEASTAIEGMGFNFKDPDGNFAFNSDENFNFNSSDFNILQPVAGGIDDGIGKLQAYLSQDGNARKFVAITGYYDTDEDNNSAFPNLGLARATAVKNYFVSKGISSAKINTFGELKDALIPDGNLYRGPLMYGISTSNDNVSGITSDTSELTALKERINANPLILYFGNAQSTINLSSEQRQKIADISKYLDKMEDASVSIVGHTDNTGGRITNTTLGLKRAGFAKNFFVNNGIPASKINTSSKGPDEPIASNDTEAGRGQNRRCVVSIN